GTRARSNDRRALRLRAPARHELPRKLRGVERLNATTLISTRPLARRRDRNAQLARPPRRRKSLLRDRLRHRQLQLLRPRASPHVSLAGRVPRFARLVFRVHLSTPLLLLQQQTRQT